MSVFLDHLLRAVRSRLVRFDPEWGGAEFALQVTLISFLAYVVPWTASRAWNLPGEIAWVGVTVAQYAAWFVVGGSRTQLWRTSLAALAISFIGVALGVRLAEPPILAAGATAMATVGAFALQAWRADAFVPALALPYTIAFTAYYDPDPNDLIPYLGTAIVAGVLYLVVRFALWPRRRRIDLAALSHAHRGELEGVLDHPRSTRRLRRTLRRMHLRALEIEARVRSVRPDLARALAAARVLVTQAAMEARGDASILGDARRALDPSGTIDDARWPLAAQLRAMVVQAAIAPDAAWTPKPEGLHEGTEAPPPPVPRRAAAVALACVGAIALGAWLSPERWAWAYITAMLVFYGIADGDDVVLKGWRRIGGTLAGGLAGLLAARFLTGHVAIEVPVIVALQFAAVWVQARSYTAMVACYTALVAMFFAATGDDVTPILMLRFWETVVGALAGTLAARLVERSTAFPEARATLADLLDATSDMLREEGAADRPSALFAELQKVLEPTRLSGVMRFSRFDRRAVERRIGHVAQLVHAAELIEVTGPGHDRHGNPDPGIAIALRDMNALGCALREERTPLATERLPDVDTSGSDTPNAHAVRDLVRQARWLRNDFATGWAER